MDPVLRAPRRRASPQPGPLMRYMLDTDTISALVHHRAGFERAAGRIDRLGLVDRLISTVTLSELQTMIAKRAMPSQGGQGLVRADPVPDRGFR